MAEEAPAKKAKPSCPAVYDVVWSVESSQSAAVDAALSEGRLPGYDACLACGGAGSLAPCDACEMTMLCPGCRAAAPHVLCRLLETVRAVEEADDEDGDDAATLLDLASRVLAGGWPSVVGQDVQRPAPELRRLWVASELLAAVLGVWTALRSPPARAVLRALRRDRERVVHVVGVEHELSGGGAAVWDWLWSDVAKLPGSTTTIGVGPEMDKGAGSPPAFEAQRVTYQEYCAVTDRWPALTVLLNPGLTVVPEYTWDEALSVFRARFSSTPLIVVAFSEEESLRDEEVLSGHGFKCLFREQVSPEWRSLRLHQSSTVASDVFRKSEWVTLYS